jgi:hypothetical protein
MRRISRNLFAFLFLAALALAGGAPVRSMPAPAAQAQKQSQELKSVTGILLSTDEDSFILEVSDGGSKREMEFFTDKATKVDGNVNVGDTAVVQYRSTDYGTNVAMRITPNKKG